MLTVDGPCVRSADDNNDTYQLGNIKSNNKCNDSTSNKKPLTITIHQRVICNITTMKRNNNYVRRYMRVFIL